MKQKVLALVFLALSSTTVVATHNMFGLHCGPRGNFFSTILSDFAIPDYFPPENPLLSSMLMDVFGMDMTMCEDYAAVHLGDSCMMHDECYATLGVTKDGCDEALLQGWQMSCLGGFTDNSDLGNYCKTMCQDLTNLMYDIMRYDDGVFCPSCEAFEKSQDQAGEMAPN